MNTRDPGLALLLGRHKYSDPAQQRPFDAGTQWQGTKLYGSHEFGRAGGTVCAVAQSYPDGRRIAVGGSGREIDLVLGLGPNAAPIDVPATFSGTFDGESAAHEWQSTIFYRNSYLISLDDDPGLLNRIAHAQSLKVSCQGQAERDYSLDGSEEAIQALQLCLGGHHRPPARYARQAPGPPEPRPAGSAPATETATASAPETEIVPAPPPVADKAAPEVDLDAVSAPAGASAPAANTGESAKGAGGAVDLDSP